MSAFSAHMDMLVAETMSDMTVEYLGANTAALLMYALGDLAAFPTIADAARGVDQSTLATKLLVALLVQHGAEVAADSLSLTLEAALGLSGAMRRYWQWQRGPRMWRKMRLYAMLVVTNVMAAMLALRAGGA